MEWCFFVFCCFAIMLDGPGASRRSVNPAVRAADEARKKQAAAAKARRATIARMPDADPLLKAIAQVTNETLIREAKAN